jgi:hypothetical protein
LFFQSNTELILLIIFLRNSHSHSLSLSLYKQNNITNLIDSYNGITHHANRESKNGEEINRKHNAKKAFGYHKFISIST